MVAVFTWPIPVSLSILRSLCLSAAVLPGFSAPLSAEVVEDLRYERYRVDLNGGRPVLAALDSATPIRRLWLRRFHGHTAWTVQWSFAWDTAADGRCAITSHRTVLRSVVTLPEREGGEPAAQADFDTYLHALRDHELGHHAIAQRAAHRIDEGIGGLPSDASCQALAERANRLGERMLDEAREAEKAYDGQTQYGRTQGAWLPR